jgi:hypothetical protein
MRSYLAAQYRSSRNGEHPTMPDWAVRHIYERRTGRPLAAFPAGMRVLNEAEFRSFVKKTPALADAQPQVVANERAAMQRRLQLAAL